MTVELIDTPGGYWLIEGTPGDYELHRVRLDRVAGAAHEATLRRYALTGDPAHLEVRP